MSTHTIPVLQVQGLHFAHPGQPPVLAGWSAELPAGVHLLHGDTASGKTTLLQLLAGDWQPSAGTLRLNGQPLDPRSPAGQAAVCGFNPRDEAFDNLTPEALMAAMQARHPTLDATAWQSHLQGFGLAPHAHKPMYAMSTGMRRKAGLAVALAASAALTLLDEPTAGLDTASVAYLAQALRQGWAGAAQRLVLMASSQRLEALPVGRVVVLGQPAGGG